MNMNYYNPVYTPQQSQQGLIWVQGEAAAKSYLVAPNNTVVLMDSEGDKFYIKSTDMSGMPTMRTFAYKELLPGGQSAPNSPILAKGGDYVERAEMDALLGRLAEIEKALGEKRPEHSCRIKKAVSDDE